MGAPAPSFLHRTASGEPISLAQFRGRVLLLELWAPWCGPCRVSLPRMADLHRAHRARGLSVVGLGLDAGPAELRRFSDELRLDFPLAAADQRTGAAYGASVLPTTVLIDRQGKIAAVVQGMDPGKLEVLEQKAIALLGQNM